MFNIRAKQLKNIIQSISISTKEEEIQSLSEQLLENYFSDENKFGKIYEILNQINILGQIYARMVSLLVTEESTDALIYKLYCMIKIGEITIVKLSVDEIVYPIDYSMKIFIAQANLETLQDELKTFKKNENHKITNLEGLFKYLITEAPTLYRKFKETKTYNHVLGLVFGVEESDEDEIKQIEHINIKEMLFMSEISGDIVQKIFMQYDGLLTYTMSLLTMISGTDYESEFKSRLNSILESLGTSTQIILLQQRLRKITERKDQNDTNLVKSKSIIIQKAVELNAEIPEKTLENCFQFISKPYEMQFAGLKKSELNHCAECSGLFENSGFILLKAHVGDLMQNKFEIASEFDNTLRKILDYFDSIIRKTNTITADLFSTGFRAAIPLFDVETCEEAGIHIKNITATSSNQKIDISDLYFDTKLRLYRQYETEWNELKKIIEQKAHEEQSMQTLLEKDRIFSQIYNGFNQMSIQWSKEAVFNGRSEEVVIASRLLFAVVQVLQQMWNVVVPFRRTLLGNETLSDFEKVSEMMREYWIQLQKLFALSLTINHIGKKLWYLNRKLVLTVGENEQYFRHPEKITILISDIPQILKQEYRQRLITKEIRRQKKEIYNELLTNIEELSIYPAEDRKLLIDFKTILDFMEVYEH